MNGKEILPEEQELKTAKVKSRVRARESERGGKVGWGPRLASIPQRDGQAAAQPPLSHHHRSHHSLAAYRPRHNHRPLPLHRRRQTKI